MNAKATELSVEAISALRQGYVIEAIKITRTTNKLDLKDAKQLVDAYLQQHPELKVRKSQMSQETALRLLVVLLGLALMLWFFFKH
jgi:ribosomal protein L7/L12